MAPRTFALSLLLLAASLGLSWGQERAIEQGRQFRSATQLSPAGQARQEAGPSVDFGDTAGEDSSFGLQQLLKQREREKYFLAFAEFSGFATSNVALTRRDEISDTFLVATFGLTYRRPIRQDLVWETTFRGGLFRYNRVSALNFISLDAGTGLTYHAAKLWDLDFYARYNFTNFINDRQGASFFQNHTLTGGLQKTIALSRAHAIYAGASAQAGFADPSIEQRNEYAAYAGYHVQLTHALEADLFYRYGYYAYMERNRRDHNNSLTISARYSLAEWLSIFASGFVGRNRSSLAVFDYDVGNVGVGLGASIRF